MLSNPPPIYRKRNELPNRKTTPVPVPPPVGPVLVAAVFQPYEGATVTLTFAEAILVEAYDGAAVSVTLVGPQEPTVFDGSGGVSVASDTSVVISLEVVSGGPADQGDVTMTVTAGVGIFAADGGAAWAGVNDLSLPFGQ